MRKCRSQKITSDKLYTVAEIVRLVTLCVLGGLSLAGCAAAPPAHVTLPGQLVDHTITLKWNQSFVNNPGCSTSVTTSCISGFNEGYLDATGKQVQLHTDTAAVCAGTTQPEACSSVFNGLLPIGMVPAYVVTTYLDQAGAAGVTAAGVSPPMQVGADQATNVTFTVAP